MLYLGAVSSRFVTFKNALKCWLCAAPRNEGMWGSHSEFWTLFDTIRGPRAPRGSLHNSYPGSNLPGHKKTLKMPSDTPLTGSCCHLRVTLPSAVPEDQVYSQQAQGNLDSAIPQQEGWKQVLWNWGPAHFRAVTSAGIGF